MLNKGEIKKETKTDILKEIEKATQWLNDNQHLTKDEYEAKQKEIEDILTPLIGIDMHTEPVPSNPINPTNTNNNPNIEEID